MPRSVSKEKGDNDKLHQFISLQKVINQTEISKSWTCKSLNHSTNWLCIFRKPFNKLPTSHLFLLNEETFFSYNPYRNVKQRRQFASNIQWRWRRMDVNIKMKMESMTLALQSFLRTGKGINWWDSSISFQQCSQYSLCFLIDQNQPI